MSSKKEFSSLELTKFFIDRIEKSDLNCFITNTFENAIEMAKESDKKISRNEEIGDFRGYSHWYERSFLY